MLHIVAFFFCPWGSEMQVMGQRDDSSFSPRWLIPKPAEVSHEWNLEPCCCVSSLEALVRLAVSKVVEQHCTLYSWDLGAFRWEGRSGELMGEVLLNPAPQGQDFLCWTGEEKGWVSWNTHRPFCLIPLGRELHRAWRSCGVSFLIDFSAWIWAPRCRGTKMLWFRGFICQTSAFWVLIVNSKVTSTALNLLWCVLL